MKEEKQTVFTLANSRQWLDFTYDDYLEYCEDNEIEPAEDDTEDYHDWAFETSQHYWEDDMQNIKYAKYDGEVVIEGSLGLWWGHPDIDPVQCNTLYDAVQKCIGESDDADVKFDAKAGVIYVHGYHHDGTNSFTIRKPDRRCKFKWTDLY